MKDVREMFNISYFDNKELSLKKHCDIYLNIEKDLISILNKYDIKYVVAETESIRDLSKENQELKKQIEEKEKSACNWKDSCLENAGKIEKLENQQKEFIEYLEKTIVDSKAGSGQQYYYQQVLEMYKEIIGGKE